MRPTGPGAGLSVASPGRGRGLSRTRRSPGGRETETSTWIASDAPTHTSSVPVRLAPSSVCPPETSCPAGRSCQEPHFPPLRDLIRALGPRCPAAHTHATMENVVVGSGSERHRAEPIRCTRSPPRGTSTESHPDLSPPVTRSDGRLPHGTPSAWSPPAAAGSPRIETAAARTKRAGRLRSRTVLPSLASLIPSVTQVTMHDRSPLWCHASLGRGSGAGPQPGENLRGIRVRPQGGEP